MPEDTIERIYAILRARNRHIELQPSLVLGADGMGLDSIAMVEVLLECEEEFGVAIATDLLAASPLTVGVLIDAVQAQVPE